MDAEEKALHKPASAGDVLALPQADSAPGPPGPEF